MVADHLNKVRRKLKNVIKSDIIKNDIGFKTQNKKIKAKNQRYGNMKNQNTERQKASFSKEQVENVDLYKPVSNKTMATCK